MTRSISQNTAPTVRGERLALAALLLFAVLNGMWSARWGIGDGVSAQTTSTWAVDTIAPVGPLKEAFNRFTRSGTEDVIYPVFHYMVLAGAYAPYVATALLTGRLAAPAAEFPFGAVDPASFFGHLTLLANLVSALMAAGCVLAMYLITRNLFGAHAALWAAVLTALLPPFAYYGGTSNLDVPYLFWLLLAFWQLTSAAVHQRLRSYIWCGIFASLAIATKDQAAGFVVMLPVLVPWLVYTDLRNKGGRASVSGVLRDPRPWAAAFAALVAFAVANNLLIGAEGYLRHLRFADEFYDANLAADGPGLLARQPALLSHSVALILQMVGPATLVLAGIGVWHCWRSRYWLALTLVLCALSYYLMIIVPTISHSRYLIGVVLLLLPFAGAAAARALDAPRGARRTAVLAVLVLALLSQAALVVHMHSTLALDSRYAMEKWVRGHVPAGATIESSTQPRYLPRLSDTYRYSIVGNSFSATSYNLLGSDLTLAALETRAPRYIMVLADSWLSGDPSRIEEPQIRAYYDALLGGRAGYEVVADFETPTWLPYRQITAGTQPRTVLLERRD